MRDPAHRPEETGPRDTVNDSEDLLSAELSAFTEGTQGPRAPFPGPVKPEIEGYEVLEPLGSGAMGTVWRARQLHTNQHVALKVLETGPGDSPRQRDRFEREIELAAQLNHPNIARVYHGGVSRGQSCYLAMELVEGEHLDAFLQRKVRQDKLSREEYVALVLLVMLDVCAGVEHAHQGQVLHRDLKPSNILVRADGRVVIVDFGVAKTVMAASGTAAGRTGRIDADALDAADYAGPETPDQPEPRGSTSRHAGPMVSRDQALATGKGVLVGTLAYMSPEQAAGRNQQLSTQSDVYSLGVILYRLLTGRYPHDLSGGDVEAVRYRKIHEPIVPPARAREDLPEPLQALLSKALEPERSDRYASVSELRSDIDAYCREKPMVAYDESPGQSVARKLAAYHVPASIGLCILTALAMVAGFHLHGLRTVNLVSVYDLLGFALLSGLGFVFLLAYFTLGARTLDLVFALVNLCSAAVCAQMFLMDNLMPLGALASDHPQAAGQALQLARGQFAVSIVALPLEIHFVLLYCGLARRYRRQILACYVVFLLAVPGVLSSHFIEAASAPTAPRVSTAHIVTWMPQPRFGATLCLIAWMLTTVLVMWVLRWRKRNLNDRTQPGPYRCIHLVQMAIAMQLVGVLVDISQAFLQISTLSAYVICAMISGLLISAALVREQFQSSRRQALQTVEALRTKSPAPESP
jgi:serine/threonine protein kinase